MVMVMVVVVMTMTMMSEKIFSRQKNRRKACLKHFSF